MKKLLLSVIAIAAAAFSVQADEATLTMTGLSNNEAEYTADPTTAPAFTIKTAKNSGSTAPAFVASGSDLRIYAKGTVTIASPNDEEMTKIVFNISTQGKKRLAPITASVGTIATQASEDETVTWTGSATEVKFTVGDNADYGSDGSTNRGQLCFSTMNMTYTSSSDPSKDDPEMSFPQASYEANLGEEFTEPVLSCNSNGAVTYTSSDEAVATVDATTGEVTLVGEGTTEIKATAAATDIYNSGYALYTLRVIDPSVIFEWAKSKGNADDFTLSSNNDIQAWSYDDRYGLKGSAYQSRKANATECIAATPVMDLTLRENAKLEYDQAFNQYKLNNTNIAVADFEGKYAFIMVKEDGATEWTLLALPKTPTEFSWDFYANGPVSLDAYKNKKIQIGFKYVSTDEIAGTWEINNIKVTGKLITAVDELATESADAAPVYYNLQGVRVSEPTHGIYIVVKGDKSYKVAL